MYPASMDLNPFSLILKAFLENLLCIRGCSGAGSESVLSNIALREPRVLGSLGEGMNEMKGDC